MKIAKGYFLSILNTLNNSIIIIKTGKKLFIKHEKHHHGGKSISSKFR
jgi:hypothetical protein